MAKLGRNVKKGRKIPEKLKKRFSCCSVIIECTEFFMERPYYLRSRAQTWSNYKHVHTLKVLIGITLYGTVSFVCRLWGGCISDKEITRKSVFYRMIEHGDQVMADRGLTVSSELAKCVATLVVPPFVKGKMQLSGLIVEREHDSTAVVLSVFM